MGELTFAERMQLEQEQKDLQILSVIGSTEASTFGELCNALRRVNLCPEKGDKTAWGMLFKKLGAYGKDGWLKIEMEGRNMKTFQLTKEGANKVRDFADSQRELFQIDEDIQDVIEQESFGRFNEHAPWKE